MTRPLQVLFPLPRCPDCTAPVLAPGSLNLVTHYAWCRQLNPPPDSRALIIITGT